MSNSDQHFPFLGEDYITRRLKDAYRPGVVYSGEDYSYLTIKTPLQCAAVLMPLIWRKNGWHLLLTHRTEEVEQHKGQVSFPGGRCDVGETTPEQTALREAQEEIGLRQEDVHLLGRLNDVLTVTLYQITPVVGVMPWPYKFHLASAEVKRAFTIPLKWLSQTENWEQRTISSTRATRLFKVVFYHPYRGEILWGASARMTQNLLTVLGLLAD